MGNIEYQVRLVDATIADIIGDKHPQGVIALNSIGVMYVSDLFKTERKDLLLRGLSQQAIRKLAEYAFLGKKTIW